MQTEIPQYLIRQKLIEFIRSDATRGLNVFPLIGTEGAHAKIDAIAGYFHKVTDVALPVFAITTDDPEDKPFSYIPWLNSLTIPQQYQASQFDRPEHRIRFTQEFTRNGLPTIAVVFGRERNKSGAVTDKKVAILYAIGGLSPQQALQDIQAITNRYRAQNN